MDRNLLGVVTHRSAVGSEADIYPSADFSRAPIKKWTLFNHLVGLRNDRHRSIASRSEPPRSEVICDGLTNDLVDNRAAADNATRRLHEFLDHYLK
jgi:hypothetical protein